MYFISLLIKLNTHSITSISASDGVYAYATVMQAMTMINEQHSQIIHNTRYGKPLSLALILDESSKSAVLRVSFMTQDATFYANTLIRAVSKNRPIIRLEEHSHSIEAIEIGSINTWSDLYRNPATNFKFQFLTPTAINKRRQGCQRFTALYPDPVDVFAGLIRRWNTLGGPTLPNGLIDHIEMGGCVIARHSLQTVEFNTPERTQVGFVGNVVYQCGKNTKDFVPTLTALTRFAAFVGVGYQSARGMGAVKVTTNN